MMYFPDFASFVAMGGHGLYVWLAFGFSMFWLLYLLLNPLIKKNQLLKMIRSQQVIQKTREQTHSSSSY